MRVSILTTAINSIQSRRKRAFISRASKYFILVFILAVNGLILGY